IDNASELAGAVSGELGNGIQFSAAGAHAGKIHAVGPGERSRGKRRSLLLQGSAGGDATNVSLKREHATGRGVNDEDKRSSAGVHGESAAAGGGDGVSPGKADIGGHRAGVVEIFCATRHVAGSIRGENAAGGKRGNTENVCSGNGERERAGH